MKIVHFCPLILTAVAMTLAAPMLVQSAEVPAPQLGTIVGAVIDVNEDIIPGATVTLQGPAPSDRRTVVTDENGYYELHDVQPETSYKVIVSAKGFAEWTSPIIVLEPGEHKTLKDCKLRLEAVQTIIDVNISPKEIAAE